MKCQTCADFIGDKCMSANHNARSFFEVLPPEELDNCDSYREAEARTDSDLEDTIQACLLRVSESEGEDITRIEDAALPFKSGPKHATEAATTTLAGFSAEARRYLHKCLKEYPEFENAKDQRFRITWRLTKWTKRGSLVFGSSGPISEANREKYDIPESWEITLSLPAWAVFDSAQRERLIHHEMMHVVRADHVVQEFPETVQRYGLSQRAHAVMVIAAVTRQDFQETIERWGLGSDGQVKLPWGGGEATIEVKIRVKVGGTIPVEPEEDRQARARRAALAERAL